MRTLPPTALRAHRARTYCLAPGLKLRSPEDAVRFVNARGFVYFWPIRGVDLPSLWTAVAGHRPVADQHDDPGHVTWGWKDGMLGRKKWFYAKLLRGKATLVSLKTLPYFYALSENYGDPEQDYLLQYEAGELTAEARAIYEVLLAKGALHSVALRKEARLTGPRFDRGLTELQVGLKVLPVGVAQAGAWRYAFNYELVDRHFPDLAAQARSIGRAQARAHLADLYLRSVGAAAPAQLVSLFRWKLAEVEKALEDLRARRRARPVQLEAGPAWATTRLEA